jgi:hypothetical protein
MKLRMPTTRVALSALCALVATSALACSGDDGNATTTSTVKRHPAPDQVAFSGDVCALVTTDEAVALLGETVTVEDARVATETTFCFYDGATQRLTVSAEEFESARDARTVYKLREPERDGTKVADLGDRAYRSTHPASDATGNKERVDLTILAGRFIVSLNRTQPVDRPALFALARTALDRLPA